MLLPVLGPVRDVAAVEGPRATTHVLLSHSSGAVSTMALSLDTPEAALSWEVVFHGEAGWASVPSGPGAVEAYGLAIADLARAAAGGGTEHPCDVRFGREVVAILDAAWARSRAGADRR